MRAALPDRDHEWLTRLYEGLRGAVLAQPRQPGTERGEGVVVLRGLAAWLECDATGTGAAPAVRTMHEQRDAPALPAGVQEQLLRVLAGLVLGGGMPQESRP